MSKIKIKVRCPHCESLNVVKNGIKSTGKQNFLCKDCRRQFQFAYQNRGANPLIKKQILSSLLNGSGIRNASRVFHVSTSSILKLIENLGNKVEIKPKKRCYESIILDELYSFVHHKGKKVWVFYAYAPETKEILAVTMGKRNIRQVRYLMLKIKYLNIKIIAYRTDAFEGFATVLKHFIHLKGKEYTKPIEGRNTCIRAHLARFQRRSTKFSKKLFYQWYMFLIFVHWLNSQSSYIL